MRIRPPACAGVRLEEFGEGVRLDWHSEQANRREHLLPACHMSEFRRTHQADLADIIATQPGADVGLRSL
jgi:hypothetical protein